LPSKTSSSEDYAEAARKTKNSHPPNCLGPLSSKTGVQKKFPVVCMKNKESRSATNGSTSISTKISAKEEVDSGTCIARKSGVNVMANKTTGDASPTISALSNALLLLPKSPESATRKTILIGKEHQGVIITHIECKTKYTVLTKSNTETDDNGLEFSKQHNITQTLSANIYFVHSCYS
jgi:hypothetical protein